MSSLFAWLSQTRSIIDLHRHSTFSSLVRWVFVILPGRWISEVFLFCLFWFMCYALPPPFAPLWDQPQNQTTWKVKLKLKCTESSFIQTESFTWTDWTSWVSLYNSNISNWSPSQEQRRQPRHSVIELPFNDSSVLLWEHTFTFFHIFMKMKH